MKNMRLINLIFSHNAYNFVLAAHNEVLGSTLLWLINRAMHLRIFFNQNVGCRKLISYHLYWCLHLLT